MEWSLQSSLFSLSKSCYCYLVLLGHCKTSSLTLSLFLTLVFSLTSQPSLDPQMPLWSRVLSSLINMTTSFLFWKLFPIPLLFSLDSVFPDPWFCLSWSSKMTYKVCLMHRIQKVVGPVIPEVKASGWKWRWGGRGLFQGVGGVQTAWTSTWGWQLGGTSRGAVVDWACRQADFSRRILTAGWGKQLGEIPEGTDYKSKELCPMLQA